MIKTEAFSIKSDLKVVKCPRTNAVRSFDDITDQVQVPNLAQQKSGRLPKLTVHVHLS